MVDTPGERGLPAPQNANYVARAACQYLKT
jgi:hypothetical protein